MPQWVFWHLEHSPPTETCHKHWNANYTLREWGTRKNSSAPRTPWQQQAAWNPCACKAHLKWPKTDAGNREVGREGSRHPNSISRFCTQCVPGNSHIVQKFPVSGLNLTWVSPKTRQTRQALLTLHLEAFRVKRNKSSSGLSVSDKQCCFGVFHERKTFMWNSANTLIRTFSVSWQEEDLWDTHKPQIYKDKKQRSESKSYSKDSSALKEPLWLWNNPLLFNQVFQTAVYMGEACPPKCLGIQTQVASLGPEG